MLGLLRLGFSFWSLDLGRRGVADDHAFVYMDILNGVILLFSEPMLLFGLYKASQEGDTKEETQGFQGQGSKLVMGHLVTNGIHTIVAFVFAFLIMTSIG